MKKYRTSSGFLVKERLFQCHLLRQYVRNVSTVAAVNRKRSACVQSKHVRFILIGWGEGQRLNCMTKNTNLILDILKNSNKRTLIQDQQGSVQTLLVQEYKTDIFERFRI